MPVEVSDIEKKVLEEKINLGLLSSIAHQKIDSEIRANGAITRIFNVLDKNFSWRRGERKNYVPTNRDLSEFIKYDRTFITTGFTLENVGQYGESEKAILKYLETVKEELDDPLDLDNLIHMAEGYKSERVVRQIYNDLRTYTNNDLLELYEYAIKCREGIGLGPKKEDIITEYFSRKGLKKLRK